MNRDLLQKAKAMEILLKNMASLYDEMMGVLNNDPLNTNELTNAVLELHGLNYVFKQKHYERLLLQMIHYEWNGRENKCYLFNTTHIDHKKLIEIVLNNIELRGYYFYELIRMSNRNDNFEWISILLDRNYKFTQPQINRMRYRYKLSTKYNNTKIETNDNFENNMITYLVLKLCGEEKVSAEFFDKVINFLKNIPPLSMYYFNIVIDSIKSYSETNREDGNIFITAMFYNIIQDTSNCDTVYDIISTKYYMYPFLCKLVIDNIYKESFVESLCEKNILIKNLGILFDCVIKHNYNVTIEFLNKILSKSEVCTINIDEDKLGNLLNVSGYIYDKHYDINTSSDVIVNFNADNKNFIEIVNNKYSGKIKSINLFKIFNCSPNNDTFNTTLNKGYSFSIDTLINEHNFVVDYNALNESLKSKNIKLISNILKHNIILDKNLINTLVTVPDTKLVYYNDKLYEQSIRWKKRRASRRILRKRKGSKLVITNKNKKNNKNKEIVIKNSTTITIVELLISHGLKIDLSCVGLLLSCNETLLNLERFGIEYDENLYFECYVNEHYPKEYMDKFTIDKNILTMRRYLNHNLSAKKIKTFLETHNLKPDRYTIEFAINNRDSFGKYLMNKVDCIPSVATMYKESLCVEKMWRKCHFNCLAFRNFIEKNNIKKEMMVEQFNVVLV